MEDSFSDLPISLLRAPNALESLVETKKMGKEKGNKKQDEGAVPEKAQLFLREITSLIQKRDQTMKEITKNVCEFHREEIKKSKFDPDRLPISLLREDDALVKLMDFKRKYENEGKREELQNQRNRDVEMLNSKLLKHLLQKFPDHEGLVKRILGDNEMDTKNFSDAIKVLSTKYPKSAQFYYKKHSSHGGFVRFLLGEKKKENMIKKPVHSLSHEFMNDFFKFIHQDRQKKFSESSFFLESYEKDMLDLIKWKYREDEKTTNLIETHRKKHHATVRVAYLIKKFPTKGKKMLSSFQNAALDNFFSTYNRSRSFACNMSTNFHRGGTIVGHTLDFKPTSKSLIKLLQEEKISFQSLVPFDHNGKLRYRLKVKNDIDGKTYKGLVRPEIFVFHSEFNNEKRGMDAFFQMGRRQLNEVAVKKILYVKGKPEIPSTVVSIAFVDHMSATSDVVCVLFDKPFEKKEHLESIRIPRTKLHRDEKIIMSSWFGARGIYLHEFINMLKFFPRAFYTIITEIVQVDIKTTSYMAGQLELYSLLCINNEEKFMNWIFEIALDLGNISKNVVDFFNANPSFNRILRRFQAFMLCDNARGCVQSGMFTFSKNYEHLVTELYTMKPLEKVFCKDMENLKKMLFDFEEKKESSEELRKNLLLVLKEKFEKIKGEILTDLTKTAYLPATIGGPRGGSGSVIEIDGRVVGLMSYSHSGALINFMVSLVYKPNAWLVLEAMKLSKFDEWIEDNKEQYSKLYGEFKEFEKVVENYNVKKEFESVEIVSLDV